MSSIALSFANASCAHCVRLVTRMLEREAGVLSVDVDRPKEQVWVSFDPTRISVEQIRRLMETTGYPTRLVAPHAAAA